MGWSYESRMAYGVTVNAWNSPGLKDLLGQYTDVLAYDAQMSLQGQGTIFVYLKSSYKTLWKDSGSYSFRSPNTNGDEFNPPEHPIIHRIDNETFAPKKTVNEILALQAVKKFCKSIERPVWIRHSYVSY